MKNAITFDQISNEDVKNDIRETLGCYSEVSLQINSETGELRASNIVMISSAANPWTTVARFEKDDVLTKDEQLLAYVRNFACYPHYYRGKRDYLALKEWKESGQDEARISIADGQIIVAA